VTVERPNLPISERSASVVRRWVDGYSRGLPADVRAARRDEIEADLWDESLAAVALGRATSIDRQRLDRLIRGIPADVTWRLGQRRGATRKTGRDTVRISRVELILLLGVAAFYGLLLLVALPAITAPDPDRWGGWGPYGMLAGLSLSVTGLILAIRRPAAGLVIAMAGTAIAMFAMPWAFFILLPAPLVAWFRYLRSRPSAGEASTAG
jgi:hypothetical protein